MNSGQLSNKDSAYCSSYIEMCMKLHLFNQDTWACLQTVTNISELSHFTACSSLDVTGVMVFDGCVFGLRCDLSHLCVLCVCVEV